MLDVPVAAVPVNVKRSNNLRESHVGSDGSRDAHLIDLQVGVWGDDSSGGEVHTLPHEVPSDTAFFPLQPLLDGFQRAARLLHRLRRRRVFMTCLPEKI